MASVNPLVSVRGQKCCKACKFFPHDPDRGKVESKCDNFVANIANMFCPSNIILTSYFSIFFGGLTFWIVYFLTLPLLMVPVIFMQTFIGQFSGNGFISAYRMAPTMRGLPYVMWFYNFATAFKSCIFVVLFFYMMFCDINEFVHHTAEVTNPGILAAGNTVVMGLAFFVLTLKISKFYKIFYATLGIPLIFIIVLIIKGFVVPGYGEFFKNLFKTDLEHFGSVTVWMAAVFCAFASLGNGVGIFTTLGSYNSNKTNPEAFAWFLCLAVSALTFLSSLVAFGTISTEDFYKMREDIAKQGQEIGNFGSFHYVLPKSGVYTGIICFSFCLLEFNSLILQLQAMSTAYFDQDAIMRDRKKITQLGAVCILLIVSMVYCIHIPVLLVIISSVIEQAARSFIFFMENQTIIYGYTERRFTRDFNYMFQKTFSNWKFYIYKIFTCCILGFLVIVFLVLAICLSENLVKTLTTWEDFLIACIMLGFYALPLTLVPYFGVMTCKKRDEIFIFDDRFLHEERWYPAPPNDPEEYEAFIGPAQLHMATCNIEEYRNTKCIHLQAADQMVY